MARVMATTIVRNPESGAILVLAKGDEVPEWATVGEHLVEVAEVEFDLADGADGGVVVKPRVIDAKSMTVDDLRAEIARRNEGRGEADQIPSDGKKADLVAALATDDESDN